MPKWNSTSYVTYSCWEGSLIHDALSSAKMEEWMLHGCGFLLLQVFSAVKSEFLFHIVCQASIVVQSLQCRTW
jgi:hypothetical protein